MSIDTPFEAETEYLYIKRIRELEAECDELQHRYDRIEAQNVKLIDDIVWFKAEIRRLKKLCKEAK